MCLQQTQEMRQTDFLHEKKEKRVLKISLVSGILFTLVELMMAILTGSQSVLMDAAFDGSELIVILVSLMLTPLLYRPISEKRPYGYAQCENLFIIVKGFMLTAVVLSLIVSNVQLMMEGGNHVKTNTIAIMEFSLASISLAVFLLLRHYGKKLKSPMITAELYGWKVDVIASVCVSLAFLVPNFLKNGPLSFLAPYFDQIVAIILAALMIPEPIRMVSRALRDLLLFAPPEDVLETIRSICYPCCESFGCRVCFLDVVQTGRKVWIALTIEQDGDSWELKPMREMISELNQKLREKIDEPLLELIPLLEPQGMAELPE